MDCVILYIREYTTETGWLCLNKEEDGMRKKRKIIWLPVLFTLFAALALTPQTAFADSSGNDDTILNKSVTATASDALKTEDVDKENGTASKNNSPKEKGTGSMTGYGTRGVSGAPGGGSIQVNTQVVNHFTDLNLTGTFELKKNTGFTATSSSEMEFGKVMSFYFKLKGGSEDELEIANGQEDNAILKLETIKDSKKYTITFIGDANGQNVSYHTENGAIDTKYTGSLLDYTGTTYEGENIILNEIRNDYYTRYIFELTVNVIGKEEVKVIETRVDLDSYFGKIMILGEDEQKIIELKKDADYVIAFKKEPEEEEIETFTENSADMVDYFKLGSDGIHLVATVNKDEALIKLTSSPAKNKATISFCGGDANANTSYILQFDSAYADIGYSKLTDLGERDGYIYKSITHYFKRFCYNCKLNPVKEENKDNDQKDNDQKDNDQSNTRPNGGSQSSSDHNDDDDDDSFYASQWVKDRRGWAYYSERGTRLSGSVSIYADGVRREKFAWAKIKNVWWPFAANGYLKTGWIFDGNDNKWYLIDENSGMKTGWYVDAEKNNTWYYLDPENGSMVTGWKLINGKWYYFSETADSSYGAMYFDTITPDGYRVDASGAWDGVNKE